MAEGFRSEHRLIDETAAYLFNHGQNFYAQQALGAHIITLDGTPGVSFVLWAPNAAAVQLVGDFNSWQPDAHPMQSLPDGFWQLFVPHLPADTLYKYRITTADGSVLFKADPFAFAAELRPGTASRVCDIAGYAWQDADWLAARRQSPHFARPMNIYELHLGSWGYHGAATYARLAAELPQYLADMGYNYVELMPVMEHPFDGSWGYQLTGYFAPTSRFGSPQDFKLLVDSLHGAGIGVILDWVPGHFCRDAHGLARFDGTPLYEEGEHPQWGTCKFNFACPQVQSFLVSNALFWLGEYHADGLRVDGVTSMLYLNFGVDDAAPKRYAADGTEENKAAIDFLRKLNRAVGQFCPDAFTVAEESTAWPLVTRPPDVGGLGFHYKWDMGWMNDTLRYVSLDFDARPQNHSLLTFSMMYAFKENFVLPLSHDEVVHGKRSLIGRQPGDYWRQFAGLRLLMLYQMAHSGAKLTFMGAEIAQFIEWRYFEPLEWFLLDYPSHAAHQNFVKSLNRFYINHTALWQQDHSWSGFIWQDADNAAQSLLIFRRQGLQPDDWLLVVLNFGVMAYADMPIGVPKPGTYVEAFNSDRPEFGGSGKLNPQALQATAAAGRLHGQPYQISINLPSLGGVIIQRDNSDVKCDTNVTENVIENVIENVTEEICNI